MAVKASPPGGATAPLGAWARLEAEIVFLRFFAPGAQPAVEAAKVCAALAPGTAHAPARYNTRPAMAQQAAHPT